MSRDRNCPKEDNTAIRPALNVTLTDPNLESSLPACLHRYATLQGLYCLTLSAIESSDFAIF